MATWNTYRFHVQHDGLACPICQPNDDTVFVDDGAHDYLLPGLHRDCRCWLELIPDTVPPDDPSGPGGGPT